MRGDGKEDGMTECQSYHDQTDRKARRKGREASVRAIQVRYKDGLWNGHEIGDMEFCSFWGVSSPLFAIWTTIRMLLLCYLRLPFGFPVPFHANQGY